ncbi:MAG: MoaD/ThiS family protein [Planctomycetaceae bacterium]|nr:MoaD/ThiS family protein [Planctomycetaceae bacterium]
MPIVFVPVQMRELTGGVDRFEVTGETLRQALRSLDEQCPALVARLRDGDGIAPGLAVSIDGAFAARGLLAKVGPRSEIHFLPAIGGG